MVRIAFLLSLMFLFVACGSSPQKEEDVSQEMMMVYTDWSESIALTHLAQNLLVNELGYDITIKLAGIDEVFAELGSSSSDVFVDAWLPDTHKDYLDEYKGRFEDLGPNYYHAKTGLVVPVYMNIDDIPGLLGDYDGAIVGIDSTAGIMRNAQIAIEKYGLDNELLVLSDAEMSERLDEAIKRRQHIVVTGWEPHWIFYRHDLKYLEDPLEVFMGEEHINTIARVGFADDFPRAAKFFERMVLTERQINALLYEVRLATEPIEGVKAWIKNNEVVVNQWIKDLRLDRDKIM